MKKIRIITLYPTFTWIYPTVEACYFGVFEGTDPATIQGVKRIELNPGDYIEAEWLGFELDRSHGEDRFFDFSRMVVVRDFGESEWRKSLEIGWTSPRLIPFNRTIENKFVLIEPVYTGDESQLDIEAIFAAAERPTNK